MSGKLYLKNRLPAILANLLGMLALALFLLADGSGVHSILFISAVWMTVLACYLTAAYFSRKKDMDGLLAMTERLEERYLIAEVMPEPEKAELQVFYRILRMAEKSMLERIGAVRRERREYREYIERWIHEVKTPITAVRLLGENNRSDFAGEIMAELEKINRFTDQALYYARSGHTEKDYSVRETRLDDVVHGAIADNKYILRQNQVAVTAEGLEKCVCTDDKWVRFMLDQIISNAVKYRTEQPQLHFSAADRGDRILLYIRDNGIGIPEADLPRVFEKGFTGRNGRIIQSATGIGLYLCRRLCEKLGIGIDVCSDGKGTTVTLSFRVNYFVKGAQG